jgi:hypothetical protein
MRNEKRFSLYNFLKSSVFDLLDNKNKLYALFFNVPSFREAVYEIYEHWFIELQKSKKKKVLIRNGYPLILNSQNKFMNSCPQVVI